MEAEKMAGKPVADSNTYPARGNCIGAAYAKRQLSVHDGRRWARVNCRAWLLTALPTYVCMGIAVRLLDEWQMGDVRELSFPYLVFHSLYKGHPNLGLRDDSSSFP